MIRRMCSCGCGEITNYGKKYINGHNRRGREQSEESKRKMSEVKQNISKETRRKMSLAQVGRTFSKEHRKNMSLAQMGHTNNKGKKHSEETKRKISLANKGNRHTEETKRKMSINSMKCRTDGYCDAWSDGEYKADLRKDICSNCGMIEKESLVRWGRVLDLHHKDGNKKNCHPDNVDTLCRICHTCADWVLRKQENVTINSLFMRA